MLDSDSHDSHNRETVKYDHGSSGNWNHVPVRASRNLPVEGEREKKRQSEIGAGGQQSRVAWLVAATLQRLLKRQISLLA
jgi:hypothetical protein